MTVTRPLVLLVVGFSSLVDLRHASANDAPPSGGPEGAPTLSLSLTPRARYQFRSGVGDAKSDVFRAGGEVGLFVPLTERLSAAASLAFEQSRYSWRDFGKVVPGVQRPIRDGSVLTLSPTVTYTLDEGWSLAGGGLIVFAAADGASWGDAGTYGGFATATYRFSQSFSLSAGVLVSSRLEDNVLALPLINFEWQIDDRWRLESTGLGLRGSYKVSDQVTIIADGGYEFREYRLKSTLAGGLGGGVYRDNAAIASLGVQWKPAERWTVEAGAGLAFGGDARFDDANGNRVTKVTTDAAPFVGLSIKFEF